MHHTSIKKVQNAKLRQQEFCEYKPENYIWRINHICWENRKLLQKFTSTTFSNKTQVAEPSNLPIHIGTVIP